MSLTTVRTARLDLVLPAEAHVDALLAMYGDEEVTRHIPHTRVTSRNGAWFKVASQLGHWQLRGYGFWVVVERATGAVVGNAGLLFPPENLQLEAGWLIARPHWRKGYAEEAVRAILDHAFRVVGADTVIAVIAPENRASLALAAKVGMEVTVTTPDVTMLRVLAP